MKSLFITIYTARRYRVYEVGPWWKFLCIDRRRKKHNRYIFGWRLWFGRSKR